MFLTKPEKNLKLIHLIMKRDGPLTTKISIRSKALYINYEDLEMLRALNLINIEYIEDDHDWNVSLTDKGVNYFENNKIKTKNFLFQSILTPILVSTATTLIALWLKGFW